MKKYYRTCSVNLLVDYAMTYAKTEAQINIAKAYCCEVAILIPLTLRKEEVQEEACLLLPRENYIADFIRYHNEVNRDKDHRADMIDAEYIHPTASIGNEGMRYAVYKPKSSKNELVGLKHMGSVVLKKGVVVGANSTIARATLDYTVIGSQTKIGCGVHIGHNVRIGNRNIITDGTVIGGSALIGNDCFIGLNSTIRNGIHICSKVFIGMGSVVVKNIDEPGVYAGNPAVFRKEWNGDF